MYHKTYFMGQSTAPDNLFCCALCVFEPNHLVLMVATSAHLGRVLKDQTSDEKAILLIRSIAV